MGVDIHGKTNDQWHWYESTRTISDTMRSSLGRDSRVGFARSHEAQKYCNMVCDESLSSCRWFSSLFSSWNQNPSGITQGAVCFRWIWFVFLLGMWTVSNRIRFNIEVFPCLFIGWLAAWLACFFCGVLNGFVRTMVVAITEWQYEWKWLLMVLRILCIFPLQWWSLDSGSTYLPG